MKLLIKFIKKDIILFILFVISIVFIAMKFSIVIHKECERLIDLENIIITLSLGYIVSYIFYFLVVFLKKESDQQNTNDYVAKRIKNILTNAYRSYSCFVTNSKLKGQTTFPSNENQIKEMILKIDPKYSFQSSTFKKKHTWYELLQHIAKDDSRDINEIFQLISYLDTELIKLLNSLRECRMFLAAKYEIVPIESIQTDASKTDIPNRLFEYFSIIDKLQIYANNNLMIFEDFKEIRKTELINHI